jgi:DNA-binding LacI/PurR family transcriptional regulator
MNRRFVIGLLTNDLVGTYQYTFWAGMKSAAQSEDCDLISFNGGEIGSADQTKRMRNATFDLVGKAKPDALVVLAPVLVNNGGLSLANSFIDALMPTPLITVGVELAGHPSSTIDNSAGMARIVEHLVRVHARRRLAFVGGPPRNPDAALRREAFVETLARLEVPFDRSLEVGGRFDFGIARDEVRALLDDGARFDALVAANDEMALGAMDALKAHGILVPQEVAVVGFDDIQDALHSTPSLTTVHQPVFEQGVSCVHRLLAMLEGVASDHAHPLAVSLVQRGSCGCQPKVIAEASTLLVPGSEHDASREDVGSSAHLDAVRKFRLLPDGSVRTAQLFEALMAALVEESGTGGSSSTIDAFLALARGFSTGRQDPDLWQTMITRIRSASLPYIRNDPEKGLVLDGLLHLLRVVAQHHVVQAATYQSLQMQRWSRRLHEISSRIQNGTGIEEIVEVVARECNSLRISSLHLLLRDYGLDSSSLRLALSIDRGIRRALPSEGEAMGPEELFRRIVHESPIRSALVVEPLFFEEVDLGYIILDLVSRRGMLLDSLRSQISAAIMGAQISIEGSSGPNGLFIPSESG